MLKTPLNLENARILLSNDDGIDAPGLKILENIARTFSDDVWVVAPLTEQSATGHSLTLRRPLRIHKQGRNKFAVDGTPTDCVLLAVNQIMRDCKPDLVLSGVNHGRNVGEDMTYSGTIAAAMEATLFGIPAMALSQNMSNGDFRERRGDIARKYAPAITHAAQVIRRVTKVLWPDDVLINVNFPAESQTPVAGIRVTRQGRSKVGDEIIENRDPHGRSYYWIGAQQEASHHSKGTDLHAVENGFVSVTPVCLDMTHKTTIKILKGVFKEN